MPYIQGTYDNDWDGVLDVTRVSALCELRSEHDNFFEDRRYALGWCDPSGGDPTGTWGSVHTLPETGWDETWTRTCPDNQFLVGVYSWHDNFREDRKFQWRCAEYGVNLSPQKYLQANCEWDANWFNQWDAAFVKTCSSDKVLAGVTSQHDNAREDRLFKFMCCNIERGPTLSPTASPTASPTGSPTPAPTGSPTSPPTSAPTSAPTASPSAFPTGSPTAAPAGPGCQTHPGGAFVRGQKLFDVSNRVKMSVRFKFVINGGFGNMVQIGAHGDDWPAIFFFGGSGVNLEFERQGESGRVTGYTTVEYGAEHWLQVDIDGLECQVYLDEVLRHDVTVEAIHEPRGATLPVFVSGAWSDVPDGSFSEFSVCTEGAPRTAAPTGSPSPPPTPAPTGSPSPKAPTQSPIPQSCQRHRNLAGSPLVRGTQVLSAPVRGEMEVSFLVTIHSVSPVWANIVHIGAENYLRAPAVFLHEQNQKKLQVAFHARNGDWPKQKAALLDIELDVEYELSIVTDNLVAAVYLDGVLQETVHLESQDRFFSEAVPVYLSNPWVPAADAVVKDLHVCAEHASS